MVWFVIQSYSYTEHTENNVGSIEAVYQSDGMKLNLLLLLNWLNYYQKKKNQIKK